MLCNTFYEKSPNKFFKCESASRPFKLTENALEGTSSEYCVSLQYITIKIEELWCLPTVQWSAPGVLAEVLEEGVGNTTAPPTTPHHQHQLKHKTKNSFWNCHSFTTIHLVLVSNTITIKLTNVTTTATFLIWSNTFITLLTLRNH